INGEFSSSWALPRGPWATRHGTARRSGRRRSASDARTAGSRTPSSSSSACRATSRSDRGRSLFGIYLSGRRGSRGSMALLLRFAGQWVAGEKMEDALRVAGDANARGMDALVNHLGEHYREKGPVEATTREYLGLLNAMRAQGIRGTVSLKP